MDGNIIDNCELEALFPDLLQPGSSDCLDQLQPHWRMEDSKESIVEQDDLPREVLARWLSLSQSRSMGTSNIEYQGRVYPLCSVSSAVKTPTTLNVLAHIYSRFYRLPTHIMPTPFPTSLPSFVALLSGFPNDDQSYPRRETGITMICVMLSLPLVIHRNDLDSRTRGKVNAILPRQACCVNARIVLENTLFIEEILGLSDSSHLQKPDLLRHFLAATQQAREADKRVEIMERQLDQLKSRRRRELAAHESFNTYLEDLCGIQGKLWEAPKLLEESSISNLITKERIKSLSANDMASRWKSKLISTSVNSTKEDRTTILEAGSFFRRPLGQEWMSIQDLRRAWQFGGVNQPFIVEQTRCEPVPSSGNVPLSLDTNWGDNHRPWEQFQPSLLRHRYERWLAQQEQQNHDCATRLSSTATSLLDVDLNSDLWQPLIISPPVVNTREDTECPGGQSEWNREASTLSQGEDIVLERFDEMADLNRYCHFEEQNEDGKECVPSMASLPSSRTWSIMNPDVVLMHDAMVRSDLENMFEPDFMIEELGFFPDPGPATDSLVDWTNNHMVLREIWAQLSPSQQQHLMTLLAKFLAAVWDQFRILQLPHSSLENSNTTFAMDIDLQERDSAMKTTMGSLLDMEEEFVRSVLDGEEGIPYSTPEELDFVTDSDEDAEQMDTSQVQARGSPDAIHPDGQDTAPHHEQYRQDIISTRSFDFSLDDLLIVTESSQDIRIAAVTRWKASSCEGPAPHPEEDLESFPTSVNKYQSMARSSEYPLIHLFSLPDVLCPSELGGQGASEDKQGLAHAFAILLAEQNMEAAEFLTDDVQVKERKLYHRWMAEWHGRFVQGLRWRNTTPLKQQQPQRHENDHCRDFSNPESGNPESGVGMAPEREERSAFEATARFLEKIAASRKEGQGKAPSSADRENGNASWAGIEKVAAQPGLGARWLSSAVSGGGASSASAAETKEAEVRSWFPVARGQCGPNREQRELCGLHDCGQHGPLSLEQQRLVRQHMWSEQMH